MILYNNDHIKRSWILEIISKMITDAKAETPTYYQNHFITIYFPRDNTRLRVKSLKLKAPNYNSIVNLKYTYR